MWLMNTSTGATSLKSRAVYRRGVLYEQNPFRQFRPLPLAALPARLLSLEHVSLPQRRYRRLDHCHRPHRVLVLVAASGLSQKVCVMCPPLKYAWPAAVGADCGIDVTDRKKVVYLRKIAHQYASRRAWVYRTHWTGLLLRVRRVA